MELGTPGVVEWAVFATGLLSGSLLLVGYVASILWPDRRFWPPGDRNWRYWGHWTLDGVHTVSILALGYLDWGSLRVAVPTSVVAGGVLVVCGGVLVICAQRSMGHDETVGVEGDLYTDGLYRYSRNPQYVGFLVATVGFVLVAASWLVAVLGVVRIAHWVVLPFPEESWLRAQYGDAFDQYQEDVPRFVSAGSLPGLVRELLSR